ncbi:undecaprenyl-diphosphatase 1 [Erysipelotrichaceae bacterium]|nr:undecaprenyl-diphosphatase 1 [Erysipelotrichaceae bacterium]
MVKFIEILGFIFLGLIQGLTEPLPISSKGHVILFNNIFGIIKGGELDIIFFLAIVHLASLVAIIAIFWDKITTLLTATWNYFIKKEKTQMNHAYARYFVLLLIAFAVFTPIAFILGETIAPKLFGDSTLVLAIGYLITSVLLLSSDFFNFPQFKTFKDIRLPDAITIGLAQVIAIIPGASRSGTTLIAGMSRNLDRESAIDFSFFLFIPTVLGANVYYILKALTGGFIFNPEMTIPYIFAFITSTIATFFSFKLFIYSVKSKKLYFFAIYTLILALLLLWNPSGLFDGGFFAA